ncbi:Acetyl-coenzyme A synthetase, cytoplasmic [Acipenser ruthenus]|uniref:Acetyl-coenzyme A synthetase, cytoplasmic n=1 Tax=Acipenser ruthenus TaxID=7906 RepID=A0A444V3L2_ACIRT|nr:Acetyl-coenzyme A synthetase, cytoplasmic [Acipenser ruthenus]
MKDASEECDPEWCDSEDPLFVLYTSGSTGKPKFEGLPTYPDVSRLWEIVDKYKVTKFYTAPTAIRLLMKFGNEPVQKSPNTPYLDLSIVFVLYSLCGVFLSSFEKQRCPIVFQSFPFFGVVPAILNESGEELEGEAEGYLVFKQPWPGVMRTVYGNHQRFETTYFKKFPGYYVTGDGCRRDKDGYYWITGRIDDMLNVSGHLLSTAEVESALVEHSAVAEAAVVSHPHDVKGECLYCFVTLKDGQEFTKALEAGLKKQVREKIGPIATPDYIQNAPGLPKTRSGKIMRRVLRKIARNDKDLGDISTLADPTVIEQLFNSRSVCKDPTKTGSTFPFFGVVPAILNESGEELEGEAEGYLVFKQPWPGVMRTVYGNHQRFETTYFKKFPGYYVTGDGCRRDKDGYYWITGRIDDMLNVSGHLLSTAEVESALVEHSAVAEAAVVSHPHDVKGECLYCFVTLKDGQEFTKALEAGLKKQVREKIGPIATPDYIQNAPGLPKTRSGKIMRRVLRKIARNDKDLGDISTLADPTVIEQLFNSRCVL